MTPTEDGRDGSPVRNRTAPGELARRFRMVARAKNEWEAAVDAVSDLVFLTDTNGVVLRCNVAASKALGRTFDRIIGSNLEDLLCAALHLTDCSLDDEEGEVRVQEEGPIFHYSRFPAHRRLKSIGWMVVLRDITELRRLRNMTTRLEMMNNLGQVLASVRHEIGNPTNAMKTALTVMAESAYEFSTEKMLSYIRRCLNDIQRIQDLLERLRAFNLFEVSVCRGVDVRALLEGEIPALREHLGQQGITLICSLPSTPGRVDATCDPRALYQILLGLIANSAEAISEGSRQGIVGINLRSRGGFVRLAVADNGPGIPPEELDKVILPLYTTKTTGTGLGLAIAHEMIARMGGEMEIGEDAALGGARVVVGVPATDGAAERQGLEETPQDPYGGQRFLHL